MVHCNFRRLYVKWRECVARAYIYFSALLHMSFSQFLTIQTYLALSLSLSLCLPLSLKDAQLADFSFTQMPSYSGGISKTNTNTHTHKLSFHFILIDLIRSDSIYTCIFYCHVSISIRMEFVKEKLYVRQNDCLSILSIFNCSELWSRYQLPVFAYQLQFFWVVGVIVNVDHWLASEHISFSIELISGFYFFTQFHFSLDFFFKSSTSNGETNTSHWK